jgi:SAM-dependent methyltransferase
MPAYDYAAVADIYDHFCVFDGDLAFFREAAATACGQVLELMAGTGRVSLPMLEAGAELSCVDSSPAMLAVLGGKLRARKLAADVVCADVGRLPLTGPFEVVMLPFQGFTELVGADLQRRMLNEVARVLAPGGRFVCTSHNPAVRGAMIDGEWHELGRFTDDAGRTLVLSLRTQHGARPRVVEGAQRIEILDCGGRQIEARTVALEFSLIPPAQIVKMATAAGLTVIEQLGDYAGSPFDEATSPAFIAVFEPAGSAKPAIERHSRSA